MDIIKMYQEYPSYNIILVLLKQLQQLADFKIKSS